LPATAAVAAAAAVGVGAIVVVVVVAAAAAAAVVVGTGRGVHFVCRRTNACIRQGWVIDMRFFIEQACRNFSNDTPLSIFCSERLL
jgi:hypothetical protein